MMYKVVENIEVKTSQVSFEEDEEKEICKMFMYKMPTWLMETSTEYTFQSQQLFAFP